LELLRDFIEESKKDLETIKAHMKNSNYDILTKTTTKLKSICSNLDLGAFISILNSIERGIKNKNYDNIKKFVDIYSKELDILSKNINI